MAENVKKNTSNEKKLGAIGFSAMMHGYMAFDKEGRASCTIPVHGETVIQGRQLKS